MARFLWSWGPAIGWMGATFWASHQPAIAIPGGAPDYVAHAIGYAVLGALYARALAGGPIRRIHRGLVFPAALLGVLYGLSDEFHQSFIPGRDASFSDVVADAVGSLAGAATAALVGRWWSSRAPSTEH